MTSKSIPLGAAIFLLVAGIFLGSVFTFGMQHWNDEVAQEDCIKIQTQFIGYEEDLRKGHIQQIAIDCANGERYFVDGACVGSDLQKQISNIPSNEDIVLFIHPNSNTILEFSTKSDTLLIFSETLNKLNKEKTAFLFLGLFMYFFSLVGLYYVVIHCTKKYKLKKNS